MRRTWGITLIAMAGLMLAPAAQAADRADLYKSKCQMCHGTDGKGTPVGIKMGAKDFHSADFLKLTDAQVAEVIAKGKNKMPAYASKLKADEISDLASYVKQLGKK